MVSSPFPPAPRWGRGAVTSLMGGCKQGACMGTCGPHVALTAPCLPLPLSTRPALSRLPGPASPPSDPSPPPPSPPPPSLPSAPCPPSPSLPPAVGASSSPAPGTALQPQESVGPGGAAEAEAALRLPALLFGAPALLGLALALVLVGLLGCRWRRRRLRAAPPPGTPEPQPRGK